ncbi:hypothetical protein V8D89_012867 [Ganoderma adspersum]
MVSTPFAPYDPSAGKTYPNVDPSKIARLEIFPPIGVARVGDSGTWPNGQPDPEHPDIEYFYGPEAPGLNDHPFGSFRDPQRRIKRQAARFRVYAYDSQGKVLGEVNNAQNYRLTWTVHVANKKAAYYLFRGRLAKTDTNLRNPDVDPVEHSSGSPFDLSLDSRKKLIIDPGPKTIARDKADPKPVPLNGKFQGTADESVDVNLGELRTDDHGRLVFLGGSGHARSVQTDYLLKDQPNIISEFDSVDWYDNACDGWVSVSVSHPAHSHLTTLKPHKATILSGPPKFAWGVDSPTSLYDIMEDIYKKHAHYEEHSGTDFFKDIWPVLSGTYKLSWVNEKAFQGHGPGGFGNFWPLLDSLSSKDAQYQALRQHIFGRLREPDYRNRDQAHVILMPRLSGDNGDANEPGTVPKLNEKSIERFAALTALQYERFRDWKDGKFSVGTPFGTKKAIEEYDLQEQPVALTRAALEQTIGDPLFPGIETYWIAKLPATFDTHVKGLHPPFRVNHEKVLPGFLSRGLSLPWQSDFSQCNTHWWPSARPDEVAVPPLEFHENDESTPKIGTTVTELAQIPRRKWTEGLRDTPDDVSSAFFPGCTDMVHQWTELGFVAKVDAVPLPAWIETERELFRGFRAA